MVTVCLTSCHGDSVLLLWLQCVVAMVTVCCCYGNSVFYLLQVEFPLYLLGIAVLVCDWFSQLALDMSQPGAETRHVLIQLLDGY